MNTRQSPLLASLLGASFLLGGCSSGFEVTGDVNTDKDVMLLWTVSSGSPDYVYKFGEGTADGESFELSLDGDPPAEAINSYGIGVAIVSTIPDGMDIPEDGKLDGDIVETYFDGNPLISNEKAIIFKSAGEGLDWSDDFSDGYTCGQCVRGGEGDFDSFEPGSCDDFDLSVESDAFCDWT